MIQLLCIIVFNGNGCLPIHCDTLYSGTKNRRLDTWQPAGGLLQGATGSKSDGKDDTLYNYYVPYSFIQC